MDQHKFKLLKTIEQKLDNIMIQWGYIYMYFFLIGPLTSQKKGITIHYILRIRISVIPQYTWFNGKHDEMVQVQVSSKSPPNFEEMKIKNIYMNM